MWRKNCPVCKQPMAKKQPTETVPCPCGKHVGRARRLIQCFARAGCTLPALTIGKGIGKRTGMCDAAGAEAWSCDITGSGWKIPTLALRTASQVTIVQNNLVGRLC